MFIQKINAVNVKNNLKNNENMQYQAPLNPVTQLSRDTVSFKSKKNPSPQELLRSVSEAFRQMKERDNLRFEGKTPEEKLKNLVGYYNENYQAVGDRFKEHINPILKFLASKGLLIEVHPYNSRFESKIVVKSGASSHLSKTWRDAHQYDLDRGHHTYVTPNSARVDAIASVREHSQFYQPSLFQEDIAARNSQFSMQKYLPKLPEAILDKMYQVGAVRASLESDIQHIDGATNDLYAKTLQELMPEDGVWGSEALAKITQVTDGYTPEYAKPFDWDAYREMMDKRFTI